MIDIAVHFNWTYVSLASAHPLFPSLHWALKVYSADEYGELGADAFKANFMESLVLLLL